MQVSRIFLQPRASVSGPSAAQVRSKDDLARLDQRLTESPDLAARFHALLAQGKRIRSSEYHLTNACNLRCDGCWFFAHGHDGETREETDLGVLASFMESEAGQRGINAALVIGGEPTLFPERLSVIVDRMDFVTISTNGMKKLPVEGYERVAIGITVFGGGRQDDQLRAIRPDGRRFTGVFEQALAHYDHDPRAGFVYALTHDGIDHIEETVHRIHQNGNLVTFNYYYRPDAGVSASASNVRTQALLDEALRVKTLYPETVVSHPAFITALLTGKAQFGEFGYTSYPSISVDHPAHRARLRNGHPVLPRFNAWSADCRTLKFCCTSGHCEGCRDSQAIYSWLLVNSSAFLESRDSFLTWIELAESYWRQFIWSPYHRHNLTENTECC